MKIIFFQTSMKFEIIFSKEKTYFLFEMTTYLNNGKILRCIVSYTLLEIILLLIIYHHNLLYITYYIFFNTLLHNLSTIYY